MIIIPLEFTLILIKKTFVSVCRSVADICFVVDSSGSIRDQNVPGQPDNWDRSLRFVSNIVQQLEIGADEVCIYHLNPRSSISYSRILSLYSSVGSENTRQPCAGNSLGRKVHDFV